MGYAKMPNSAHSLGQTHIWYVSPAVNKFMTVPLVDPYLLLIFDSDMKDRMDKSDGLYDTSAASAAISPSGSLSSSLWLKKWHFILSTSFHHILNHHYCRGSVLICQCLTNLAWSSFYYDHSKIESYIYVEIFLENSPQHFVLWQSTWEHLEIKRINVNDTFAHQESFGTNICIWCYGKHRWLPLETHLSLSAGATGKGPAGVSCLEKETIKTQLRILMPNDRLNQVTPSRFHSIHDPDLLF